jgi:hypothetical protein
VFDLRRLHPSNWNLRLAWDVFMVWIALVNVGLILFDLTYLPLRPLYRDWVPAVTRAYDPVLGISPHPLTTRVLDEVEDLDRLLALDPESADLARRTASLREATRRVLAENPFGRSGQDRTLEVLRALLGQQTAIDLSRADGIERAVDAYWTSDPAVLAERIDEFDARLRPLFERNYFREIDLDGHPVNRFWMIDLPFLTLFLVEFGARWAAAIRRRRHAKWYFFPIFQWYDVLGLIPYTQFRVFRLFRIVSIYLRLRRSEVSRVGRDAISRAVAYVSNIVAEEISDAVALRILNETQDELRDGTGRRIVDETLRERRGDIERVVVTSIRAAVASPALQQRVRELLRLNLENAVARTEAIRAVPLPGVVLRPLLRSTGEVVLDTTLETLVATLDSEDGERAAREVAAAILDHVLEGPWRGELDAVAAGIGLDVLERMKETVAVKKWAHERQRHVAPLPAEDDPGPGRETTPAPDRDTGNDPRDGREDRSADGGDDTHRAR